MRISKLPIWIIVLFLLCSFASGYYSVIDDFNRANSKTVGNGWFETETINITNQTLYANKFNLLKGAVSRDLGNRPAFNITFKTILRTNLNLCPAVFIDNLNDTSNASDYVYSGLGMRFFALSPVNRVDLYCNGTAKQVITGAGWNIWYDVTYVWNGTHQMVKYWQTGKVEQQGWNATQKCSNVNLSLTTDHKYLLLIADGDGAPDGNMQFDDLVDWLGWGGGGANFSITAKDSYTGASINNFSAYLNGTLYHSNITTGTIVTEILQSKNHTFDIEVSSPLYINHTYSAYNTTNDLLAILDLAGAILFRFYDIETLVSITGNVSALIINDTSQRNFTFSGGTGRISEFNLGDEYTAKFSTSGYNDTGVTFIYNFNITDINVYMYRNATRVTFTVEDTLLNVVPNALVRVEAFVNGTYQEIGSKLTDGVGRAVFFLKRDTQHRVTISKEGYVTKVVIIQTDLEEYTVRLALEREFDFDTPQTGVSYDWYPKNDTLKPSMVNFTMTINDSGSSLQYFGIRIYNMSVLVAQTQKTGLAAGGVVNLSFNCSAYNGSILQVEFFFKRTGFSEATKQVFYRISDEVAAFTGNVLQMRDWCIENISTRDMIIIWITVLLVFSAVLVAFGVIGGKNILATSLFSWIAAWSIGMSGFMLIIISLINIVFIIASLKAMSSFEGDFD